MNIPGPWVIPRVSTALSILMHNLGHRIACGKGEKVSLYSRGRMFEHMMFVQSGVIEGEVVIPGYDDLPFFVSVALQGSLLGSVDPASDRDSVYRRYRAVSNCELLTVPKDLFMRLTDHEVSWYKKMVEYRADCLHSERHGLMVTRACEPPERMGAFIYAYCQRSDASFDAAIDDEAKEWIALPSLPPNLLISKIIGCDASAADKIFKAWSTEGVVRKLHRSILFRREKLKEHRTLIERFS